MKQTEMNPEETRKFFAELNEVCQRDPDTKFTLEELSERLEIPSTVLLVFLLRAFISLPPEMRAGLTMIFCASHHVQGIMTTGGQLLGVRVTVNFPELFVPDERGDISRDALN